MRTWTGTIRRLSWHDRALAVQAACLLTIAAPVLRIVRLSHVIGVLNRRLSHPEAAGDPERPLALAHLVAMAARHTPWSNTCLHRSVVLWWVLGREGFPSDLVVGARKDNGELTAHAWVEHRGAVLNDDPGAVGGYVVFQRTPHA
jgi:hypothetical protein